MAPSKQLIRYCFLVAMGHYTGVKGPEEMHIHSHIWNYI
jgi:hypothetical protein